MLLAFILLSMIMTAKLDFLLVHATDWTCKLIITTTIIITTTTIIITTTTIIITTTITIIIIIKNVKIIIVKTCFE